MMVATTSISRPKGAMCFPATRGRRVGRRKAGFTCSASLLWLRPCDLDAVASSSAHRKQTLLPIVLGFQRLASFLRVSSAVHGVLFMSRLSALLTSFIILLTAQAQPVS